MFVNVYKKLKKVNWKAPERIVPAGYALYMLLGAGLLMLPWCHSKTTSAGALDCLFTAVSAVSTTGLSTVSTGGDYSFGGQLVVLILIQAGGLGYMTFGSFIALAVSGNISSFRRGVATSVLSMPTGFDLKRFLITIALFTLVIEALGAIALYPFFRSYGFEMAWWQAIFHSISAFCTAGFSLIDSSFEGFRGNFWFTAIIMILSYTGAIGFIVMSDWWEWMTGHKKGMTLTSKIILWCTIIISISGTIILTLEESSIAHLPVMERISTSLFQIMTASTTVGFNTVPIGTLSSSSLFLLTIAMIIGASPSGTGGGVKTTCVTALWAVMISVLRRDNEARFAGRSIPDSRLKAATASMMFYLFTLGVGIFLITLTESHSLTALMFECASALGTVGLSCGITSDLSTPGKILIISLMFLGRIGPLALGMALFSAHRKACSLAEEDVAI
ncbi:MAG: hypothetical protein JXR78_13125 [Victivallales bacterium]|nr:hypothetical protein [Victivallales bacterium]